MSHNILYLLYILVLLPNAGSAGLVDNQVDLKLRKLIKSRNLNGQPGLLIPKVSIHSPLAELGKRLFFSTKLSGQGEIACVTCHHPLFGGSDALSLPIGINAVDPDVIGPEREQSRHTIDIDDGPNVPRNSLSTFNAIFYNQCMFWDCRVEALDAPLGTNGLGHRILRTPDTTMGMSRIRANTLLEAQAAFPVTSENEMRGYFLKNEDSEILRNILAKRFEEDQSNWLIHFRAAFGDSLAVRDLFTFENIAKALAAYEASQIFTDTPWKAYVEGNRDAISLKAKKGALLFLESQAEGGYGCAECHSGDFFTDESFHVTAIPQIGRGKEDGKHENNDFGRFILTGDPNHKFAFRTPTLINVEVTGPYGHAGAYKSLKSTIRHMMNPQKALSQFDYSLSHLSKRIQSSHAKENTMEAIKQLNKLQKEGKSKMISYPMNESHVDQIYEFLISLTDPCTKQADCLMDWFKIE